MFTSITDAIKLKIGPGNSSAPTINCKAYADSST